MDLRAAAFLALAGAFRFAAGFLFVGAFFFAAAFFLAAGFRFVGAFFLAGARRSSSTGSETSSSWRPSGVSWVEGGAR